MPRPSLHVACLGIVLLAASDLLAQKKERDPFDDHRRTYAGYLARPTLIKRTEGRVRFAETKDERALDMLVKSYSKPEEPRDHNKYLITTIVADHFAESADDALLERWRKRHKKSIDAWMWYETLQLPRMRERRAELLELVNSRENVYCRAAAFEAAIRHVDSYSSDADLAEYCVSKLAELPTKPIERAMCTEAIGSILIKKRSRIREEPWKEICRSLIHATFDDTAAPRRSKVVVARYLAETFAVQNLGFDSHHWIVELDKIPNARPRKKGNTFTIGFAGIRTKGDNIVYVIDASDSMLKKVTNNPKKTDKGPTTGAKKKKVEREKGVVPTAKDLDWSRIQTRFDAAREFLRVSLATLEKDQKFSVILFGTEAIPLGATPKLVKASKGNIKKVLAELYTLEERPPTRDRPDGRLRGLTNFHGGVRLAMRMTQSGVTNKAEYANDKSMFEGCDTMFILSDGTPSADDWPGNDKPEAHDRAGDPETHVPQKMQPIMHFQGPYGSPIGGSFHLLEEDIRRLNLLRRCEIHCVGIGEAQTHFLEAVARIGHGKAIRIDSQLKEGK